VPTLPCLGFEFAYHSFKLDTNRFEGNGPAPTCQRSRRRKFGTRARATCALQGRSSARWLMAGLRRRGPPVMIVEVQPSGPFGAALLGLLEEERRRPAVGPWPLAPHHAHCHLRRGSDLPTSNRAWGDPGRAWAAGWAIWVDGELAQAQTGASGQGDVSVAHEVPAPQSWSMSEGAARRGSVPTGSQFEIRAWPLRAPSWPAVARAPHA
jgi:hypothetical protein